MRAHFALNFYTPNPNLNDLSTKKSTNLFVTPEKYGATSVYLIETLLGCDLMLNLNLHPNEF
jgi:hypothetical protein